MTTIRLPVTLCGWIIIAACCFFCNVQAITPTAQMEVRVVDGSSNNLLLFASQASFGPRSPMKTPTFSLSTTTFEASEDESNPYAPLTWTSSSLCGDNDSDTSMIANSIVMVARGQCTFQYKAWKAQQLGAVGVIVYNTLSSRYSLNETTNYDDDSGISQIVFPTSKVDYDCDQGQAQVPSNLLSYDPVPYNADQNNPVLSGNDASTNQCLHYAKDDLEQCDSKRCLIVNATSSTTTQVCCAWDLHLWLYADGDFKGDGSNQDNSISIPSVMVTMEEADELFQLLSGQNNIQVRVYSRWRPSYNMSAILIWMLGVTVATIAAYGSAHEYRQSAKQVHDHILRVEQQAPTNDENRSSVAAASGKRPPSFQEETLELEPIHAVGFVVMASTSLLILFYFEIYNVVKVMYAFGCSNAVNQVIVTPIVSQIFHRYSHIKRRLIWRSEDFGDITNWDIASFIISYVWGGTWLYMALFVRESETYLFFWITQDIMGACMCVTFLMVIQLNSIQVATILLVVAFLYDIFFVFISPLIFSESVMITVATSGGPPKADPQWCEKYPSDADCQGGDPLPMLLTVPRLFDYEPGSSLLGLGDIVLPGLLLSFAARLDAAKALVSLVSAGREAVSTHGCNRNTGCFSGYYYFWPLVASYAVGLMMANVAVYVMEMGQPALLYLVPCTLGTMCYIGGKRQELRQLWDGPRVLAAADKIVYGNNEEQEASERRRPNDGGGNDNDGVATDRFEDECGDVPLLATKKQAGCDVA